jgi:hypothetical protein
MVRAGVRLFGAGAVVAVLAATLAMTAPAHADSSNLDPQQVRGSINGQPAALGSTFTVITTTTTNG